MIVNGRPRTVVADGVLSLTQRRDPAGSVRRSSVIRPLGGPKCVLGAIPTLPQGPRLTGRLSPSSTERKCSSSGSLKHAFETIWHGLKIVRVISSENTVTWSSDRSPPRPAHLFLDRHDFEGSPSRGSDASSVRALRPVTRFGAICRFRRELECAQQFQTGARTPYRRFRGLGPPKSPKDGPNSTN
jgi:hypothetical protein